MKMEFYLKGRKENLAVNMMPLLHLILLRRFIQIFLASPLYSHLWLLKLMLLCKSSTCLQHFMHRNLYKAEICLKG